jgi:putative ABC transport system permease protein
VGLLLVMACCNAANMLLARSTSREREISMRGALGASRGRIVRQLLTESALLALGGAIGGCVLAYGGIALLARFMPRQGVPWETQLRLDLPVLLFALGTTVIATVGFGLFPALQGARRELVAGTGGDGKGATAGRRHRRMRDSLVVVQVALSIVLSLGAGLLVRSFVNLVRIDLGVNPENLLIAGLAFPRDQSGAVDHQRRFYREALDRLRGIPEVLSVAASSGGLPPFGATRSGLEIPGLTLPPQASALVVFCSDQMLNTLGLPLLAGRGFSIADVESARKVAVVNETFAKRYLGPDAPLARIVSLPALGRLRPTPIADPAFEIVGVVRDALNQGIREPPSPQVYVPYTLRGAESFALVLRTSGDPTRVLRTVRREVAAIDPRVAVTRPITLDAMLQRSYFAQPKFSLFVLGLFSCAGLLLVALGVYGVLAYTVAQREREFAIRMALGGDRGHVRRLVFSTGLRLIGAGMVVGLVAGTLTNRVIASQLWKTSPGDPATIATAVSIVAIIGLLACWVPARRAVRSEPIVALRHE